MTQRYRRVNVVFLSQVFLASATLLWAGNFVMGRLLRGDVPPVTLAFWRWALALLVLLPLTLGDLRRQRRLILGQWRLVFALGATGIAAYPVFVYQALTTTTALNALLILATVPLLISLVAWVMLREPVTSFQGVGMLFSVGGTVLILARGDPNILLHLHLSVGDLWMLAAVPLWAVYAVLLKRRPPMLSPLTLLAASVMVGIVCLTPVYIWQVLQGEQLVLTGANLIGLAYIASVSALGHILWNRGIVAVGPNQAGVFINLIPVFGAVLSILFLGEQIALYHIAAALLVLAGIVLASQPAPIRRPEPAPLTVEIERV